MDRISTRSTPQSRLEYLKYAYPVRLDGDSSKGRVIRNGGSDLLPYRRRDHVHHLEGGSESALELSLATRLFLLSLAVTSLCLYGGSGMGGGTSEYTAVLLQHTRQKCRNMQSRNVSTCTAGLFSNYGASETSYCRCVSSQPLMN